MARGEKHRLKYTDSNSNEQELGVIAADQPGERELDRGKKTHRAKNWDALKVWTDQDIRDQVPIKLSDFGNAENGQKEPEVLFQSYDGSSWTTRGRFYPTSRGAFNKKGDLAIQFMDMGKWLGLKDITLDPAASAGNVAYDPGDLTNSDIIEVMKEVVTAIDEQINSNNDGYVLDHPSKNNISVPSIERYGLEDAPAKKAFFELVKEKDWAIKFPHQTNGNGKYEIRIAPKGFGGTVDTIVDRSSFSGNNTLGVFKEWQKEDISEIINAVKVIGTTETTKNGATVTKTIESDIKTDSGSISDYGRRYDVRQVGYVQNKTEANNIAQDIVDAKSQSREGGSVRAQPRYEGNEANNSFQLKSSNKGIDASFTCIEQNSYYPGNHSTLKFEFEKKHEKEADKRENLRDERESLISSSNSVGHLHGNSNPSQNNHPHGGNNPSQNNHDHPGNNPSQNNHDHPGNNPSQSNHDHSLPDVTSKAEDNVAFTKSNDTFGEGGGDFSVDSSGWTFVGGTERLTPNALYHSIFFSINTIQSNTDLNVAITLDSEGTGAGEDELQHHSIHQSVGNQDAGDLIGDTAGDQDNQLLISVLVDAEQFGDKSGYNAWVSSQGSGSPNINTSIDAVAYTHTHNIPFNTDNINTNGDTANLGSHPNTDGGTASLNSHPDTDGNTAVLNSHPDTDGATANLNSHPDTKNKDINQSKEEKITRN